MKRLLGGMVYYWSLGLFFATGLLNTCAQTFTEAMPGVQICFPGIAAWADYDADGDFDAMVYGFQDETFRALLYQNVAYWKLQQVTLPPIQQSALSPTANWGDNNRDGLPDVMIISHDEARRALTRILHQTPDHTFNDSGISLRGEPAVWADLDNDGDLDILTTTSTEWEWSTNFLYWNEGGTNFTASTPDVGWVGKAAAIDVDRDGDLDLIIGPQGVPSVARIYRNEGHRRFTDTGVSIKECAASPAAWFDADSDGDLDFADTGTGAFDMPGPKLFRNDGYFHFTDANPELSASTYGTLRWADYNQDGRPDLLLVGPGIRLFLGEGSGPISEREITSTSIKSGKAEVMDLDGDGDIDFMAAGTPFTSSEFQTMFYRNTTVVRTPVPLPPTGLVSRIIGRRAVLGWNRPSGTSPAGSFNLRVGRRSGACDVLSPLVTTNGQCLTATLGNVQASTNWIFDQLPPGTYYWSVQSVDHSYRGSAFAEEVSFVIPENPVVPDPPAISGLQHQFIEEDTSCLVPFNIGSGASLSDLEFAVESTNPALTPASGLELGGAGTNRWLLVKPGENLSGTAFLTVRVSNSEGQSAYSTFLLTVSSVNDAPLLGPISNQVIVAGAPPLEMNFFAADAETNAQFLSYTVTSSNPALIPLSGIQLSPSTLTLRITPQVNRTGSSTLTLRVSDGLAEATTSFVVTILPQLFAPTADRIPGFNGANIDFADFDGDHDLDALLTSAGWPGTVRYFRNRGSALFEDSGFNRSDWLWNIECLVDYDRDGDVDAILAGAVTSILGYSSPQILRNDGAGSFAVITNVPGLNGNLDTGFPYRRNAWGDVDNDGDIDLAISVYNGARILLNRNGSFAQSVPLPSVYGSVALGDYNGDALLDVALSGTVSSGATTNIILRGLQNGQFAPSQISLDQSGSGPIGFADLDNDGLLDFWQVGFESRIRNILLYRNLGGGQYALPLVIQLALLDPSTSRWADFDGDGDLDFLIEISYPTSNQPLGKAISILRNEGGFRFTSLGDAVPGVKARYIGIGDLDNDGDVDLSATILETTENIRFLTNRASQANTPPAAPGSLETHVQGDSVWLNWQPATDFNQGGGLTYNLRVGTSPGSGNVVPSMSLADGYRQIFAFGNAGTRTNAYLTNLVGETFYWSVQAVDNSYIGGPFAPERTFIINLPGNLPPMIGGLTNLVMEEDTVSRIPITVSDDRTSTENIRLRVSSADPILLPASGLLLDGVGTNRILRFLPATNQFGETTVTIEATDAVGMVSRSTFGVVVLGVNDAPFLSTIPAQTNAFSAEPTIINFTVGDSDDLLEDLVVTATSSNEELVPATNIVFSGTSSNRSAAIIPERPTEGETLITVSVRDRSGATNAVTFLLALHNQVFRQLPTSFGGVRSGSIAWGDYDNDHDLDLAISGQGLQQTALYRNEGGGVFVKAETDFPSVDGGGANWADFDNDGDLDLLIHGRSLTTSGLRADLYRNLGNGTFEWIDSGLSGRYGPAGWGDFDNDGWLDVVSTGETSSQIYRNLRNGEFQSVLSFIGAVAQTFLYRAGDGPWVDVNEDGRADLLLQQQIVFGAVDQLCLVDESGTSTLAAVPWGGTAVAWADFDNDGHPDVLESSSIRGSLQVLHNGGAGEFSPLGGVIQTNWTPDSVAVADFNNDGKFDLLSSGYEGNYNYQTRLYEHLDTGEWNPVITPLLDYHYATAAWADIDNDGDVDLLIDGQRNEQPLSGYSTLLFRNDQVRSNSAPMPPMGLRMRYNQDSAVLSWDAGTDPNQTNGLTYNVRIGTAAGGIDVLSPMSAPDGYRLVPKRGNAGWAHEKIIRGLVPGETYYWSVQSIDNSFIGSSFAQEVSFLVGGFPVVDRIPDQTLDEDGFLDIPITVGDPAGRIDEATFLAASTDAVLIPDSGLNWSGSGSNRVLRIRPAPDRNGSTSIQITVVNPAGGMASQSFNVTVRPVNDSPNAQTLRLVLEEDTSLAFSAAGTDPDNDPLGYEMASYPLQGFLLGNPPELTYFPAPNFFGEDHFELWIRDDKGASNVISIVFEVTPVADVPTPRLTVRFLSDGTPLLSLRAEPLQDYRIEMSTDLVGWEPLGTYRTLGDLIEFIGTPAPAGAARFYRARHP